MKALATALSIAAAPAAGLAEASTLTPAEARPNMAGSPETFTGSVNIAFLFPPTEPFEASAAEVTFLPGARSAWHSHPAGQMLVVTSGIGWVQERGAPKRIIRAGDVVWCSPGVEHWHGATDATAMSHIALQQAGEGGAVLWGDYVTDAEFLE
ncbi:MAG: cupin domain-containing protein [Maritimibacter sp.]|nr:cupin domain-containing protein [Maritimibacter sp.]